MISLASSLQKLQVVLGGAVSTTECPVVVGYTEGDDNERQQKRTANTITTGGTAVDALIGASEGRQVTAFSLFNADSATVTATVRYTDGTSTRKIVVVALAVGDILLFSMDQGWHVIDSTGARKTTAAATSIANSQATSAATSAGTQVSAADSKGTSAGTQASTADSKGTSAGTAASVADSKALSVSTLTSTADSKGVSAAVIGSTASSNQSLGSSAAWSTTLSKTKSSFGF